MKKSQKMSSLTKGLIIGGSILGTGLIYEILGDTVINKTPTLLKLIRGQGKYEQVAKENMQKIYKEMNDLTMFKEKGCQQFKERFEYFKKEFEYIKGLIIGYETNDIWRKISFVLNDDGNMYTTNEEDTKGLSNQKLITGTQKKKFNLKLMKEFDDIFSGKKAINKCEKIIEGIKMKSEGEYWYSICKSDDHLVLSKVKYGAKELTYNFEIRYKK